MHRQMILTDIHRTIRMSEIRCLSFDELLKRLETIWSDPCGSEIVYRLCEEELSHNEMFALGVSIQRLADAVDHLPSAQKATPDRAVRRILARMPAEIAAPIAEQWLEHPRKFRREVAYRVLREAGLTAASGQYLLEVFRRTGDQECLHLIARNPIATSQLNVAGIINDVGEDYWRTRLVQAALTSDKMKAMPLADTHPFEFVHAIGRMKDLTALPKLRQIFNEHSANLDFLSLYAWVLGQLGAGNDLAALKSHMEELR